MTRTRPSTDSTQIQTAFSLAILAIILAAGLAAQTEASLVGTWRLVSWESRDAEGRVSHPMGADAVGQVMFDATGNVSIHLMQQNRPRFASGDRIAGTSEKVRGAFNGYLGYFGHYIFDAGTGSLFIRASGASYPNMVDTTQMRSIAIQGDRFTATTPPTLLDGRMVTSVLVWQRTR